MNEDYKKEQIIERIREHLLTKNKMEYLSESSLPSLELLATEIEDYITNVTERQKPLFSTIAFATQFLPNFLVANISQEMLTPYIVGQVTNYFKPKEAAKIATYFRKDFLGEVAIYSDKNQVALIIQELPIDTAYSILLELIKKDYFSRLGEISDLLPLELLLKILNRIPDKVHVNKILENMKNSEHTKNLTKKIRLTVI